MFLHPRYDKLASMPNLFSTGSRIVNFSFRDISAKSTILKNKNSNLFIAFSNCPSADSESN